MAAQGRRISSPVSQIKSAATMAAPHMRGRMVVFFIISLLSTLDIKMAIHGMRDEFQTGVGKRWTVIKANETGVR